MNEETPDSIIAHCNTLDNSGAFAWWLRRNVTEPLSDASAALHDLTRTPDQRTAALIEWTRLDSQRAFLEQERALANRRK